MYDLLLAFGCDFSWLCQMFILFFVSKCPQIFTTTIGNKFIVNAYYEFNNVGQTFGITLQMYAKIPNSTNEYKNVIWLFFSQQICSFFASAFFALYEIIIIIIIIDYLNECVFYLTLSICMRLSRFIFWYLAKSKNLIEHHVNLCLHICIQIKY